MKQGNIVQKNWILAVALLASVASMPAISAPAGNQRAILESLVQCKATANDVVQFNNLVDKQKITLPPDEKNAGWGGVAWKVDPAITFGNVKSNVVVMSDRLTFYLLIESPKPRADIQQVVKALDLKESTPNDQYFDYRREDGERTIQVISIANSAVNYNVGCFYDQDSVRRAQRHK
jgi:hypothetical protein